MPVSIPNPYSGDDDETCSASFVAQQAYLGGPSVGNQQTEAQFNKSKQLGEWGVITGKLFNGEIPDGTKVLTFKNAYGSSRGYLYVKDGKLIQRVYASGKMKEKEVQPSAGQGFIESGVFDTTIPEATAAKPKPELIPFTVEDAQKIGGDPSDGYGNGEIIAVKPSGEYVVYDGKTDSFISYGPSASGFGYDEITEDDSLKMVTKDGGWFKPDGKTTTPNAKPATTTAKAPGTNGPIAAPVASTPVNAGSTSVGSMSNEDVAAMFVKIKDDLAKEQGLNIKGSNFELDLVVYKAIGEKTGYETSEVKGKIDAYKAEGNKLSALKKKVLNGSKKVPEGNPQPTKQTAPSSPLSSPQAKAKAPDPEPHDVPTVATPKVADEVKEAVKVAVAEEPKKHYSDEDIAAAYIIAKDSIVAASNGKWTLYSKNDELDLDIAVQVGLKTGFNPTQQKIAIANYLGSGKKLSTLKKQLAKQGAFDPKADTLKKSGSAKTADEKKKDVDAKADAGYTPTTTPATGTPPTDTGKPAPKRVGREDAQSGAIDHITKENQLAIYKAFKDKGAPAYLSSSNEQTYVAIKGVQSTFSANGQDYTLLQILRIIDNQGALKFQAENTKLFEKKTATWLTSPEGTSYIKAKEVELAKAAEEALKQAKLKQEAEKLAKELENNQPPLPADSALFQDMTPSKALEFQRQQLEAKPFGPGEKTALAHYTGNAYTEMNSHLRNLPGGDSLSETSRKAIVKAQAGMRPAPENMLLKRGTGANQFVTLGVGRGDTSVIWGLTGRSFKDNGFLSTSANDRAAFGGEVLLEVECPKGVPTMYVDNFSKHPGEKEQLIQAGCTYKILNVRKLTHTFVVRVRVVDWPGKDD